jgi:hypothetical protein
MNPLLCTIFALYDTVVPKDMLMSVLYPVIAYSLANAVWLKMASREISKLLII